MTNRDLQTLVGLDGRCSYNDANKQKFRKYALKLLRELRKLLQVDADVRFNPGGIAVSGDAILHSDVVYVTFNADAICGLGILYRTCEGRKDYSGGRNNFFHLSRLPDEGVEGLAQAVQAVQ